MSEPRFRAGDVVVLKSGSKPLTVTQAESKDVKVCWWDDNKQKLGSSSIHQDALKLAIDMNAANGKAPLA